MKKGWRLLFIFGAFLSLLGAVVAAEPPSAVSQSPAAIPDITPSPAPALALDAPDPDVVLVGNTYYAFTTGTTWGNYIGVLVDSTGNPQAGWQTLNGTGGSSALPSPPLTSSGGWEQVNTQNAPGVFFYGGEWVMFYDAFSPTYGAYCLSVATSPNVQGPYVDQSSGPMECQAGIGGSIDPSPFVDPTTGQPWLVWKSNGGTSTQPADIWSAPLSASGLSLAGAPVPILSQDSSYYLWQTTIEGPQMAYINGSYYLFFSGGSYQSAGYAEGYALCDGPVGPCGDVERGPILSSYGSTAGPGGATVFTDASGSWYMAYAAWNSRCTSYSCGGARQFYVAPLHFVPEPVLEPLKEPVVGSADTQDGDGYWTVAADGGIFTYGDAGFFGSTGALRLNKPIVGMAAAPNGQGYWLVASDGGIFTFGDAAFFGSTGAIRLNQPIVGMAAAPDGRGYWLVAADGGIFAFGDARYFGSTGAIRLNKPIVGMAAAPDGRGYWFVASDGGIFAYGDANYFGSTGSRPLSQPIVGMAATSDGEGYWFVSSDGWIYTFGDAGNYGSSGGSYFGAPVVSLHDSEDGAGYRFVNAAGEVVTFGDARFYGPAT